MDNALKVFFKTIQSKPYWAKGNAQLNQSAEMAFNSSVISRLQEQVTEDVYGMMGSILKGYFEAVVMCRNNKLSEALTQLQACDKRATQLPPKAIGYVELYKMAAWSNYFYKSASWRKSIECIKIGLDKSLVLEESGYKEFIYWRVGQLFNAINVYYKQGKHATSLAVLQNLLNYLCTGKAKGLLITNWNNTYLQDNQILLDGCLYNTALVIATRNIQHTSHRLHSNNYYYNTFFKLLKHNIKHHSLNDEILYNWAHTKCSYYESGIDNFVENTLEFLYNPNEAGNYDIVKANLLVQIIAHTQKEPISKEILVTIRQYIDSNLENGAKKLFASIY